MIWNIILRSACLTTQQHQYPLWNVSFFKHHRRVEHRDGTSTKKIAPVRKTIHSLGVMRELLGASNDRYLAFLSQLARIIHEGP